MRDSHMTIYKNEYLFILLISGPSELSESPQVRQLRSEGGTSKACSRNCEAALRGKARIKASGRSCSDRIRDPAVDPNRSRRRRQWTGDSQHATRGGCKRRCESPDCTDGKSRGERRPTGRICAWRLIRSCDPHGGRPAQVVSTYRYTPSTKKILSTSARPLAAMHQLPTCNEKSRICMSALQRASITSVSREIHSQTFR